MTVNICVGRHSTCQIESLGLSLVDLAVQRTPNTGEMPTKDAYCTHIHTVTVVASLIRSKQKTVMRGCHCNMGQILQRGSSSAPPILAVLP